MSLRNRLVVPVIFSALALLVGCGGSSTNSVTPPPSGGFSNTNFNGTYTFSFTGGDANGVFAIAGSLVACGCSAGTISSGSLDFVDPTGVDPASAIGSNSTYHINADGRGTARLMYTPTGGTASEIDVDFVLSSSSHGMIMEYDSNGGGSGTIDQQPAAVAQTSLAATPYAFSLSGSDNSNNTLLSVGALTLDSGGNIQTGAVQDFNYSATPTTQLTLTGTVTVGSGTTPGTAQLSTSFGNFTFDVYAIDSSHLKLIENDGQAILVGDAFAQTSTSFPTGTLVFQVAGLDTSSNLMTAAGLMSSSGAAIPSGTEDINDDGTIDNGTNPATPFNFTGFDTSSGGGRYLLTLSNFAGASLFAAYPSSGGLLLMQVDTGLAAGTMSGIALTQTSTTGLAASQGYAMGLSGEDTVGVAQLDEIAEFKTIGTGLSGLIDNDESLATSNLNGSYTTGSNGTGSVTFTSQQELFYYGVDDSTTLFITADSSEAAMGALQLQTTPTNAAFAVAKSPRALPTPRPMVRKRSSSPSRRGGHQINTFE